MKSAVAERVRKHRETLRAAGLKPVQIWLPDSRSESFRQQCERESLLVAAHPNDPLESDTLTWIAEVADTTGWV
jgi:hypothetical protein